MPIISGIVGSQGARNAGRTIGAAGTAASTAIGTAGNQAAAGTTAAGAAGQAGGIFGSWCRAASRRCSFPGHDQ